MTTEIADSTDLSIGVHTVDKPVKGYRFFDKCVVQSYTDMLTGSWKEYDHCYAEVTVEKGKKIVRPRWRLSSDQPSDILRTNGLHVGEIKTADGQKCSSAKAEFNGGYNRPNKSYTSELDEDINNEFQKGLHFCRTKDGNFRINTTCTQYSWWGLSKKEHWDRNY